MWRHVVRLPAASQFHHRRRSLFASLSNRLVNEDRCAEDTVRAELEAVGKPVRAYDVLLADQARRPGGRLVTRNTKEFARVQGLKMECWAACRR
jgi:predicted nucleic acid-binding protein